MKLRKFYGECIATTLLLAGCGISLAPAGSGAALSPDQARALAQQAYIYGYAPLSNYAKQSPRALQPGTVGYTGTNKLYNLPLLMNPVTDQLAGVPSPNNDTLYSSGLLDLRQQPVVVSAAPVPDASRYYSLQLLDLNTDVLPYISTITNHNQGGHYLVVGPDYSGPIDATQFTGVIQSPSRIVTILGRVQVLDDADQLAAAQVQSGFAIQTLSDYQGSAAPAGAAPSTLPAYDASTAQGLGYFNWLNLILSLQPLDASDPQLAAQLAQIEVGDGRSFNAADFSPQLQAALQQGLADGAAAVQAAGLSTALLQNGWSSVNPAVLSDSGSFGTDYLGRAAVALTLLYMNTRTEAWYGIADIDATGQTLSGANNYTLHFAAGQLPPAQYFWSVTAYDYATKLLIPNAIARYKISSTSSAVQYNADGSLDIPIQQNAPLSAQGLANWLPVSSDQFYLIIRSYGPGSGILDGSWIPPGVEPAN
jgi:hypothetical protein